MADDLEHRQVRRRVGVGDGLLERQSLGVGVLHHRQRAGLAGRRSLDELAGVGRAVGGRRQRGADDLVEERPQRLDDEAERAGDQDRPVAEAPVLADAAHPARERLRDDQLGEQLPRVGVDPLDGSSLVAAVEVTEEVAPVAPVEGQQRRRLFEHPGREAHPLVDVEVPGRQPRVRLDDVGRDQRVLEVEGGDVAVGGEDGAPSPLFARGTRALPRRRADACVFDDRRQVDLLHEVVPVDDGGVEGEEGTIGVVERVRQRHESIHAVDRLGLRVGAVQLDVPARPVDLGPTVLEGRRERGLLAPHRQRRRQLLRGVDDLGRPLELARHPSSSGERPLGHHDRLALGVVDRVAGEVVVDEVDQMPVAQRLP